jgi:hypothetical protein
MPPRHVYWTIIYGNQPTSFRAATSDELLPTLRQLQTRHPDAVMMWFARGRLWKSPEEAREDLMRHRARPRREERPAWTSGARRDRDPREKAERRGREWRPGGAHRDPRDRFKVPRDVKRKRFAARVRRNAVAPRPRKKKDNDE